MPAHFARGDAAHDLGKRQAAALAALAHAAEQRAQQLALVRQPLLVALGLQAPAEAALRAQPSGLGARDRDEQPQAAVQRVRLGAAHLQVRLPRALLAVGLLGAVAVAGALLLAVLVALLRLGGARRAQLGRGRALAALRLGVRAGRGPLQGPPDPAILAIEPPRVRRPRLAVAAAGVAAGGGFSGQPVRPARRGALPHPAGQAALLGRQGHLRGLGRQLNPARPAHREGRWGSGTHRRRHLRVERPLPRRGTGHHPWAPPPAANAPPPTPMWPP